MAEFITQNILARKIICFASCFLLSLAFFHLFERFSDKVRYPSVWLKLAIALGNAAVAVTITLMWSNPQLPVSVLLCVATLIAELSLLTEDRAVAYVNFFFYALVYAFLSLDLSSALYTLLFNGHFEPGSFAHQSSLLTLALLLLALIFYISAHTNKELVQTQATLMHSKRRGSMLTIFYVAVSIIMFCSSQLTLTLTYDGSIAHRTLVLLHWNLILKNGLIVASFFLICVISALQEQSDERKKAAEGDLARERNFRSTTQQHSLIHYSANITLNQLEEGAECFSGQILNDSDNYTEMLINFTRLCVHPEDWKVLFEINTVEYYEQKLQTTPSYAIRFRLSPVRAFNYINISNEDADKMRRSFSEWTWVELQCTITRNEASSDIFAYFSLNDVNEQVETENALRQAARTDALTGLFNRAAIEDHIKDAMLRPDSKGALFIIDLDHFKEVNDTLGHPAGDRILQETAQIIRKAFRAGDIVGRLGGDEFCVFAPGLSITKVIEQCASDMNKAGRRSLPCEGAEPIQISFSIGIACFPTHANDYQTLYRCADTALYESKQSGRDTYHIYHAKMKNE